jgi:hypothetical protein
MRQLALAALLLGACDAADPAAPDGGIVGDGAIDPDAPPGCSRPALDAPWLGELLATTVAELTAMPRATTMERERARSYLRTALAAQGWAATYQTYPGGANVVAEIPATMGDGKRIVVGAHFDTVDGSPGASDNATGVAVVVALGRYLQATPCRTAPITLAMFDQEELGFFGSRALARSVRPADIAAVHTIDQVGWDADGDRRFELELPTPALEAQWQAAAAVLGVPLTTTATGGTDHEAFRDEGHAAVGLTEEYVGGDTSPHRHAASDVASTVDADYHALAAQLTGQVVLEAVAP